MSRQPIQTDRAPAAIGPYSQAVRSGQTVFLSGQIPLDPATGDVVAGDIDAQARRASPGNYKFSRLCGAFMLLSAQSAAHAATATAGKEPKCAPPARS